MLISLGDRPLDWILTAYGQAINARAVWVKLLIKTASHRCQWYPLDTLNCWQTLQQWGTAPQTLRWHNFLMGGIPPYLPPKPRDKRLKTLQIKEPKNDISTRSPDELDCIRLDCSSCTSLDAIALSIRSHHHRTLHPHRLSHQTLLLFQARWQWAWCFCAPTEFQMVDLALSQSF